MYKPVSICLISRLGAFTLVLCAFAVACVNGEQAESPQDADGKVYRPPSAVPETPLVVKLPSPSPVMNDPGETLRPTSTPTCDDNLRFLEDLTFPDGSTVIQGDLIDKRWNVENTGTCNWNNGYRLRLIQGPDLSAPAEQALFPARSGTQAPIRILFTAPSEPGTYRSAWQAYNPRGEAFGDMIYIEIIVVADGP